jgi:putative hydrolase of the HAD superfamily
LATAVLFDWGDTLAGDVWSEKLVLAATDAGLQAVGREGLPSPEQILSCLHEREARRVLADPDDEADLIADYRGCFEQLRSPLTDDELERFLEAIHAVWARHERPHRDAHALLDALSSRGLVVAIVANAASPRRFLEPILGQQGLLERVDTVVFSSDLGKCKPHPAPFERALKAIDTQAEGAFFVGDRLYEDVLGASRLGMRTVQATWFVEDDNERGGTPDYRAAAPLDVLHFVDG